MQVRDTSTASGTKCGLTNRLTEGLRDGGNGQNTRRVRDRGEKGVGPQRISTTICAPRSRESAPGCWFRRAVTPQEGEPRTSPYASSCATLTSPFVARHSRWYSACAAVDGLVSRRGTMSLKTSCSPKRCWRRAYARNLSDSVSRRPGSSAGAPPGEGCGEGDRANGRSGEVATRSGSSRTRSSVGRRTLEADELASLLGEQAFDRLGSRGRREQRRRVTAADGADGRQCQSDESSVQEARRTRRARAPPSRRDCQRRSRGRPCGRDLRASS